MSIRGVEYGCAVGFPNLAVGYEIGAYVVPLPVANLREEQILAELQTLYVRASGYKT